MPETNEALNPTLVAKPALSRFRRLWMALIAALGLIIVAVITVGSMPFTPDIPPAGLVNGHPGSGGVRRQFPEMKVRESNPMTAEKVALGRLLYFDPVLSGDNTQSCATCHHPDLGFSDGRHLAMGVGGRRSWPRPSRR